MKAFFRIFTGCLIFILLGCSEQSADELIVIDVSKSYPQKEIYLNDIADLSFVQLDDSNPDYLFNGIVRAKTKSYFVVADSRSGDILFFNSEGKPVSKFNHKGNGPGEYRQLAKIIYDEGNDELIANERNKIHIYTLTGEYKHTFSFPKETHINDYAVLNDNSIILYDMLEQNLASMVRLGLKEPSKDAKKIIIPNEDRLESAFARISRKDGRIEEYIKVPEDFWEVELTAAMEDGMKLAAPTPRITVCKDGLLLHNQETDTVYLYGRDHTFTPFMTQVPSVKDINPGVYINTVVDRGNYQFIELHILKIQLPGPLMRSYLVREKSSGKIYEPRIIWNDFEGRNILIDRSVVLGSPNAQEGILSFTVDEITEANGKGKVKGELKKFVEQMNEDNENDVIAVLRFK